tara:strand:- start:4243 stop:5184 length:942 start_codon:yes stop_codon:yes gene_type:complete
MKVVSYYNVVPMVNKSQEKFDILTKFIKGVNAAGDEGILHNGNNVIEADVGVIQGWQHNNGKATKGHLRLRQDVIDTQLRLGKQVCAADANLFLYATPSNAPHHYLRYSFNGVFPNTGNYFDNTPDPKRWQMISKDLGITTEAHKTTGNNIVLCLQRQGGWSMGEINVVDWATKTINNIRKYSDRTIIVRPHPKDKKALISYIPELQQIYRSNKSIEFSTQDAPLAQDLSNAWAVVNHNSSSIVGSVIQGYSAFITDPVSSQCAEVAHTDFAQLETPTEFDRQTWLERISMFHWKFSELEDGSAWRHMRQYIK